MHFASSLPLFIRTNTKLARMAADLERAHVALKELNRPGPERIRAELEKTIGRSLHNICSGIEAILEDVAMTIDGEKPPRGKARNTLLIERMSTATSTRPVVIDCLPEMRDLMCFKRSFGISHDAAPPCSGAVEKLKAVDETILPNLIDRLDILRMFLEAEVGGTVEPGFPP